MTLPTTSLPRHLGPVDGLLMAPVEPAGVWPAFRALREGMRRRGGSPARATFLLAFDADGRPADDARAVAVLLLGYRTAASAA